MGEGGVVFALELAHHGAAPCSAGLRGTGGFRIDKRRCPRRIPSTDPQPASRAIRQSLADAGVAPENVDYVNGTRPVRPSKILRGITSN